jgi:hypothetical protein
VKTRSINAKSMLVYILYYLESMEGMIVVVERPIRISAVVVPSVTLKNI